jgi:putative membrane protein
VRANETVQRIWQSIVLGAAQAIALGLLAWATPGLQFANWQTVVAAVVLLSLLSGAGWWVYTRLLQWLPPLTYPLISLAVASGMVAVADRLLPGIVVADWWTGVLVVAAMTAAGALVGTLLLLDDDRAGMFDRNVTKRFVPRRARPAPTDVPGILYIEIDGLSLPVLRQALERGAMPNVKRLLDAGTHRLVGWTPDSSPQTVSSQAGILMGNNENLPSFRWYDRDRKKVTLPGLPADTAMVEAELRCGRDLLADGGASRVNMFSGGASESTYTFSTLLSTSNKSPAYYLFLLNPYIVTRLITLFIADCWHETYFGVRQRLRDERPRKSRRAPYPLLRAFMTSLMAELGLYTLITDIVRGVPAVYISFTGYDEVAHYSGIAREDAWSVLYRLDRQFARVGRAIESAPRPYAIVLLSDHGQTEGEPFKQRYGVSLADLVARFAGTAVDEGPASSEDWALLSTVLTDATRQGTRSAGALKGALGGSIGQDGHVAVGEHADERHAAAAQDSKGLLTLASGCLGMVYVKESPVRLSYEQVMDRYPNLIPGLVQHEGIGFVMASSELRGGLVIGRHGVYFLDEDRYEGQNPLEGYGPAAVGLLRRTNRFQRNVPELQINSVYDPLTGQVSSFESQIGSHGGVGGLQMEPFLLFPAQLDPGPEPIIGAMAVNTVLRRWRAELQGTSAATIAADAEHPSPAVVGQGNT